VGGAALLGLARARSPRQERSMKRFTTPATFLVLCALAEPAMAIEKAQYHVVQVLQGVEVREYAPSLVAETEVSGSREEAGNAGFRRLAGYIFGKNRGEKKIAMTAPVAQQERLDRGPSTWVIQFMMPSEYARDTLPEPINPAVRFREVPARRVVALRYSGTWSEERYVEKLAELRAAMEKEGLRAVGEPVWARFDPPFMPWFLRTNEILVEIAP
jgi:hypothetical protein